MAALLLAWIASLRVLARFRGQICGSGGLSGRTTGITVGSRAVIASPERRAGEVAFAAANTLLHKQWRGGGRGLGSTWVSLCLLSHAHFLSLTGCCPGQRDEGWVAKEQPVLVCE